MEATGGIASPHPSVWYRSALAADPQTLEDLGPWFDDAKMASEMQRWVEKEEQTALQSLQIAERADGARPAAKRGQAPPAG